MTALTELAMWATWESRVCAGLPLFATSPLYVDQDVETADVDRVLATVVDPVDRDGMTRDVAHGGLVFQSARGPVTRMWVDGNVEIDFLRRTLPVPLVTCDVLDIGAGYGRLAVMLAPLVRSVTCADAVAISTALSRAYTQQYAPTVRVLDLVDVLAEPFDATLAINIHSWNECTVEQIGGWLDLMAAVPYLFTVSHDAEYSTWGGDRASFRPLLLDHYTLLAEERIGFGAVPHALWKRRAA